MTHQPLGAENNSSCKDCAHFSQSPEILVAIADTDADGGCLKWMDSTSAKHSCQGYQPRAEGEGLLDGATSPWGMW